MANKALVFILTLVILLCFVSCGKSSPKPTEHKDVVSVESIVVSPYKSGDRIVTDAKIRNLSDEKIDWISIKVKALDQNGDAMKSFDIVVNDVDANQAVTSEGFGIEFVEYSKIESFSVTSYELGKRNENGTYSIIDSDSFETSISFVFSEEISATNPVFYATSYLWLPQSSSAEQSESTEAVPVYAKTREAIYGQTYVYSDYTIDENGRITGYKKNDEKFTLTYDEKGNLLTEKRESSNGITYTDTYTYDENNMLIRQDDSSRNNTYIFTYEYDDQGRVIKKHSELKDGDYPQDWLYEYDENNVLIKETQVSKHSTYEITYAYDENGNVKSETSVNKEDGSTDYQPVTYEIVGYYTPAN